MSFALSLLFFSCKKNQAGGNATISGIVKHHSKVINNATVFIKYNAKELPGTDTTLYDDKLKVDANGNFKFELYKGNYFLYAVGYDYAIPAPYKVVAGLPVKLRAKENVEVTIYVTEGD
ncbi:MAG: hypothetical protein AB7O73_11760 [Bacteroidia bacterium]